MAKEITQYITADVLLENGLTLSQERFAMAYIECGDAKEAWKATWGRDPSPKELKAVVGSPPLIRRVTMLYNQRVAVMQHGCQVDIDLLVRELEQARQIAIAEREPSAAIAATMGKAKLHGLLIDRKEISLKRPEDMSEAELREVLGLEFEEDLRAGNGLAIEQRMEDGNPEGVGGPLFDALPQEKV